VPHNTPASRCPRPPPHARRGRHHSTPTNADAVSVASGGVVPKAALGAAAYESGSGSFDEAGGGWGGGRGRLMVDDPLTGRDVSAGTYRCGTAGRGRVAGPWGPARAGGGRVNGQKRTPQRRRRLLVVITRPPPLTPCPPSPSVDDLRLAFTRAARRLEALARGRGRAKDGGGGSGGGRPPNYLHGLFEVEAALARSPRDVHGQGFPGNEPPPRRGPPPRGRLGRGGAPREVYAADEGPGEEFDLAELGGDAVLYGGGGQAAGQAGGSGGGGGEGAQRRRGRR
jgi:hypothetical protein